LTTWKTPRLPDNSAFCSLLFGQPSHEKWAFSAYIAFGAQKFPNVAVDGHLGIAISPALYAIFGSTHLGIVIPTGA
jgi:hypothetical protein